MPVVATREQVLQILTEVKDPELPVIDVVELGIVRDVVFDDGGVVVDVTPTYSGCPAMEVIEREIVTTLNAHGFDRVRVRMSFTPSWTTDWLTDSTKQKLKDYGIAPPGAAESPRGGIAELVTLRRARPTTECPYCGSANTEERSEFGSTACKAIHFCNGCHQPFDRFKSL